MFKKITTAALSLLVLQSFAQDLPAPSQKGEVEQMVGLTSIEIEYSRPNVNDRVIWGELVPFDKIWRTGANAATSIEFSNDVTVNETKVPAGKYGFFAIPGKEEWTLIINKDFDMWGTGDYKEENDVVRVKAKPTTVAKTESMTFGINNVKDDKCTIDLSWDEVMVSLSVDANSREQALANIDAEIKAIENPFRIYNSSARYYVDNGIELEKAVEYAKKSVAGEAKFWNVYTLSLAYAANKDFKNAIASAEQSKELATKAEYPPYVKMNDENIAKWKKMK